MEQRDEEEKSTLRLVAYQELLQEFSEDVSLLWCQRQIPVLEQPPSAIDFLRNHVAVSRPCIIRNAFLNDDGQPLSLSLDEIIALQPDIDLTVDVTPDGHGDCIRLVRFPETLSASCSKKGEQDVIVRHCFVKPKTQRMSIQEFCRQLRLARLPTGNGDDNSLLTDRVFETTSTFSGTSNNVCARVGALEPDNDNSEVYCDGVVYYSRQNDCLRQEVASLWNNNNNNNKPLFPQRIPWAEEAFQSSSSSQGNGDFPCPDAVNLWIGNEQAVSSMHKDHYENLFYVLDGEKVFTLCPPSDAPFLYEQLIPSGTFDVETSEASSEWKVRLDLVISSGNDDDDKVKSLSTQHVELDTVPWVTADVTKYSKSCNSNSSNNNNDPSKDKFPLLQYCHPQTIRVRAGEMLYLPALWFHRVTQSCETVGINYWYDMNFEGPSWCYFRFLQQLKSKRNTTANAAAAADDDDDGKATLQSHKSQQDTAESILS